MRAKLESLVGQMVTVQTQYTRWVGVLYRLSSYRVSVKDSQTRERATVMFLPRDVATINIESITLKDGNH